MKKISAIFLVMLSLNAGAQDTTRLSLLFTGDIMGHDSQIASAYNSTTKQYDYHPCFQFVKPYIESVDLAIGNLELTLAGPPYKGYPQFSSPDELAVALKDAGFDVLVTANNHSVDRGRKGIERTIQMLDSFKITHTGTFTDETFRLNDYPLIINRNGFRLALLNYTYGTNGIPVPSPTIVNLIDTAAIRKDLTLAKAQLPDAVIVFVHWGSEYQSLPNKSQKELAEFCFNHGASLVIGAHPHVLQPMEWRKEKNQLVVYSLGNFVSGQRKRFTDGGSMVRVELEKISYSPDSIITTVDSAGYILEWVYRTHNTWDYYMLPVPSFEFDTTGFIKDATSRLALQTFIKDSRKLFDKHNLAMLELKDRFSEPAVIYRVLLESKLTEEDDMISLSRYPEVFDLEIQKDPNGNTIIYSGIFVDLKQAQNHCRKLRETGMFQDVRVVQPDQYTLQE
jgi:poly-gamma-glutamate synthesis protein (capsule biosynthesis protein)